MNNTMMSISDYIRDNYADFGLNDPNDLVLLEHNKVQLANGTKKLIVLPLRTLPDADRQVPFGNLIGTGQKAERFMTLVEFECKSRAPDPAVDFYWNLVRQFRDNVYNALAGTNRGGLDIPRYDWSNPRSPTQAGEIWFEIDPKKGSPIEDPIEDPNDPANKSIFLTYHVHWWSPV